MVVKRDWRFFLVCFQAEARVIGLPQQTNVPAPVPITLTLFPQVLQTYAPSSFVVIFRLHCQPPQLIAFKRVGRFFELRMV
jgi:hypothetical protein